MGWFGKSKEVKWEVPADQLSHLFHEAMNLLEQNGERLMSIQSALDYSIHLLKKQNPEKEFLAELIDSYVESLRDIYIAMASLNDANHEVMDLVSTRKSSPLVLAAAGASTDLGYEAIGEQKGLIKDNLISLRVDLNFAKVIIETAWNSARKAKPIGISRIEESRNGEEEWGWIDEDTWKVSNPFRYQSILGSSKYLNQYSLPAESKKEAKSPRLFPMKPDIDAREAASNVRRGPRRFPTAAERLALKQSIDSQIHLTNEPPKSNNESKLSSKGNHKNQESIEVIGQAEVKKLCLRIKLEVVPLDHLSDLPIGDAIGEFYDDGSWEVKLDESSSSYMGEGGKKLDWTYGFFGYENDRIYLSLFFTSARVVELEDVQPLDLWLNQFHMNTNKVVD